MHDFAPSIRKREKRDRFYRALKFWCTQFTVISVTIVVIVFFIAVGYIAGSVHTHHEYQAVSLAFDDAVSAQRPFYFTPNDVSYRVIPKGKKVFIKPQQMAEGARL